MINRTKFYETIRPMFGGKISESQVKGMEAILNEYEANYSTLNLHSLAYIFATAFHEVDKRMQPIEEYGKGKGRKYGTYQKMDGTQYLGYPHIYYGRGFVQLTWYENYEKAGKKLGIDLLNKPQLALDLEVATKILFQGMVDGWFTGRKLSQYFEGKIDYQGARRIINGTDKAIMIAGYAQTFFNGLK